MARIVALLEEGDFERAVETLTAAFMDDSAVAEVIPDETLRARISPDLYAAMLRYCMRYGIAEQADNAAGIALWLGPRRIDVSAWQSLRCGFVRVAGRLDAGSRAYFLAKWGRIGKVHKMLMPSPHRYLWALGVRPDMQGAGLGTALIESMLSRSREDNLPLYLEAFHQQNVDFYLNRGFEVLKTEAIPGGTTQLWSMAHWIHAGPGVGM